MTEEQWALIRHEQQADECDLIKQNPNWDLQQFCQHYWGFLTLTTQNQNDKAEYNDWLTHLTQTDYTSP